MNWLPNWLSMPLPLDWLAQATSPAPAPTADELALIKQQMAFLKDANAALATSFDRYVKMVQLTLATTGGIVGIIAVLGAAVSIKSLRDLYDTLKSVEGKVRDAVDQEVAIALRRDRRRLNRLEAILAREDIPERVCLDSVIPAPVPAQRPRSLTLLLEVLQRRGFNVVPTYEPAFQAAQAIQQRPMFTADIVVLDLYHGGLDQDTAKADAVIRAIAAKVPPQQAALVVYGNGRYGAVQELVQREDYINASNGPLSFVARVLEAAYVADAFKGV